MKHKVSIKLKFWVTASVLVVIILSLATLQSCKNEKDNLIIDYAYQYAPTDSGHYIIYDVDSIVYGTTRDTAKYQLLEIITDTFRDNLDELAYRLERYRRPDATAGWTIDRVWYVKKTTTTYQKIEDNIKFVKLIFPPKEGEEWNGNIYIPTVDPYRVYQNWNYNYTLVNTPYTIGSFSFDSTLTVSEIDDENAIEKTLRKEVYAKGVGLIYQEWESLTRNVGNDWITGPRTGFRIRMKVVEHN